MRAFPILTYTPAPELAGRIAFTSQSPDLFALALDPESYLPVVKPRFKEPGLVPESPEFMEACLSHFRGLQERKSLREQELACWYYLQQLPDGTSFEGWILGISALDYEEGRILKHEKTLRDKESKIAAHIKLLQVVAEPVLLTASLPDSLDTLAANIRGGAEETHFTDSLGRSHSLWKITSEEAIRQIREDFARMPRLYIADGHDRCAATCLHIRHSGMNPEKNGIMALVMDKKSLSIKSFHRVITASAPADRLEEICRKKNWEIHKLEELPANPETSSIVAMSSSACFAIKPGSAFSGTGFAHSLEVARLESEIFPDLFGIENTRIDSRIAFLRGDVSAIRLKEILNEEKAGWIFMVPANSMDDIERVADAGEVMPPKSTWVEPKLMTGMLVMRLDTA
jgi:uncharacterized protein (DUF1015 family)